MNFLRMLIVVLISGAFIAGCGDGDTINGNNGDIIPDVETIIGDDGATMALIPAGEFQMGDAFNESTDDELPVHTVYVGAFYMDVYEVTNARCQKFMDETGHEAPELWDDDSFNGFHAPDQPVVNVTWHDADAYAEWAGKRLPTEAEWEKAARGGLVGKRYPWGDEEPGADGIYHANYYAGNNGAADGYEYTAPVGSFAPNGYGLYDMAGNAWEWCADWYGEDYYSISPDRNPTGPDSGEFRAIRGGSWSFGIPRASERIERGRAPGTYPSEGFRCVSQD